MWKDWIEYGPKPEMSSGTVLNHCLRENRPRDSLDDTRRSMMIANYMTLNSQIHVLGISWLQRISPKSTTYLPAIQCSRPPGQISKMDAQDIQNGKSSSFYRCETCCGLDEAWNCSESCGLECCSKGVWGAPTAGKYHVGTSRMTIQEMFADPKSLILPRSGYTIKDRRIVNFISDNPSSQNRTRYQKFPSQLLK